MAISKTVAITFTVNGDSYTRPVVLSAGGNIEIEEAVADGATVLAITLAIDVSELELLVIDSDQDITIKTNSSGSPDDTLTVTGGKPIQWFTGCGMTCPLTVDTTVIYIANASGTAATLRISGLQDVTP